VQTSKVMRLYYALPGSNQLNKYVRAVPAAFVGSASTFRLEEKIYSEIKV
jgi:hypothetical protein